MTDVQSQIQNLKLRIRNLNCTDMTQQAQIDEILASVLDIESNYQTLIEKGQPDGYASLDNTGVVPLTQLPSVFIPLNVANYSALPPANTVSGKTYSVLNSQGTAWLPGSLGGTYYSKGFYYSDGTTWNYMGSTPYQASQSEVDTGTDSTVFVTPLTFEGANKWTTKQDTLVSGTTIKTINGSSVVGSGDLTVTSTTSESVEITKIAGENISGGMAVIIWTDNKLYKYDITNINHAGLSCGVSKTSATTGNPLTIVVEGKVVEGGAGWSVGQSYFVASNSTLTTIPPAHNICKKIGTGIDVDTILVNNYPELILL